MIHRIFPLIFIVFFCYNIRCQNYRFNYSPLRNYSPDSTIINEINTSYKTHLNSLSIQKKDLLKEVGYAINGLSDYLNDLYNEGLLMAKDTLSNYVQRITNNIILKNPAYFNSPYKVFIYRTTVANAASFGQNVILLNLELIMKLNSEEEMAFITEITALKSDVPNFYLTVKVHKSPITGRPIAAIITR